MKILSFQNYNLTNKNQVASNNHKITINLHSSPEINLNAKKISFSHWQGSYQDRTNKTPMYRWSASLLRILERTDSEMKDLAEYFYNFSDNDLRNVAAEAHWISSENRDKASSKLISYVKPLREKAFKMLRTIQELETKKLQGVSNIVEQKNRVNRELISLIDAEKKGEIKSVPEGERHPIPNGILIYGTSKEKEEFINWITDSAGAIVKGFKHNPDNPMRTIDNITDFAEKSEAGFPHSKTRTLLIIDDLDKMLTSKDNIDDIDIIGRFKGFVEHMSNDYHMTIIAKTDKPLEDFEAASIASHRFTKIDLKDGISEDELKQLEKLKKEIKRLDDKVESKSRFKGEYW